MASSKAPAFQFYAADWLSDEQVQLMTLEEEGVYIRLIAYCWREGSIPADTKAISRLCKGASEEAIQSVLGCFDEHPNYPGRMKHPRLEKEREKQEQWSKKKSAAGKASGKSRRERRLHAEQVLNTCSDSVRTEREQKRTLQSSSSFASSSANKTTTPDGVVADATAERPEEFANVWNRERGTLPKVRDFPDSRKRRVKIRMGQGLTTEKFGEVVRRCTATPFLRGENPNGWMASFDWLMANDVNISKVLEGKYDGSNSNGHKTRESHFEKLERELGLAQTAAVPAGEGAAGEG